MHIESDHYSKKTFWTLFGTNIGTLLGGKGTISEPKHEGSSHTYHLGTQSQLRYIYFLNYGLQEIELPSDYVGSAIPEMSQVELVNARACVVNGNVYIKADGIREEK